MYLLYSDLSGPLADYSFRSEVPHATEGPPVDDVNVSTSEGTGDAGAFTRSTSLLRRLVSSRSESRRQERVAADSENLFDGAHP
ncbi:hypothetical protein SAMN05414139_02774 [Burkholderia sp. D7]|nr:hypothetical protein SAMN05414139_02774 [Burkholderia sp. D7]